MPDLNEFLKTNESEIRKQPDKMRHQTSKQVLRSKETRPWSSQINEINFTEDQQKTDFFSTVGLGILKQNRKFLISSFLVCALLFFSMAVLYPSHYFSTLQSFAPERAENISSRLNLLSNRIEYASFPVENRLPTSLIARRLQNAEVRAWVTEQINRKSLELGLPQTTKIDDISVETHYNPTSETLTIEGHAENAENAAMAAQLYWKYFVNVQSKLDETHAEKVRSWIALTNGKIEQQIEMLTKNFTRKSKVANGGIQIGYLRNNLSESYAKQSFKKNQLSQLRAELEAADQTKNIDDIQVPSDFDISKLLQIRQQLLASSENTYYFKRIEEIEKEVPALIKEKLRQTDLDLKGLSQDSLSIQNQLSQTKSYEAKENISNEKDNSIRIQLASLREQQGDLSKLSIQLDVEKAIKTNEFRVLTPAIANPESMRPMRSVKYTIAALASLLTPLILLLMISCFRREYK